MIYDDILSPLPSTTKGGGVSMLIPNGGSDQRAPLP